MIGVSFQCGQRVGIKTNILNSFTSNLRGRFVAFANPLTFPDGFKGKGQLALIEFDNCAQKLWVVKNKLRKLRIDTYEVAIEAGSEQFFEVLKDLPLLTICETIGQIALPNYIFTKTPLYLFDGDDEVSEEPQLKRGRNNISTASTATRLYTLFEKIPYVRSIELQVYLLDTILAKIFEPSPFPPPNQGRSPLFTKNKNNTESFDVPRFQSLSQYIAFTSNNVSISTSSSYDNPLSSPYASSSSDKRRSANREKQPTRKSATLPIASSSSSESPPSPSIFRKKRSRKSIPSSSLSSLASAEKKITPKSAPSSSSIIPQSPSAFQKKEENTREERESRRK